MVDPTQIIVLVTTYNRPDLLEQRALKSISTQTERYDAVVLVDNSDSEVTKKKNREIFERVICDGVYLINERTPGAAGTWNHGLNWIDENYPDSWVAIIDDDDEWTPEHLEICKLNMGENDAVVSGIRTMLDGEPIEDRTPDSFSISDFFASNPGWQGSNTFIRIESIKKAGFFDEKLLCTHDRDLAIRCLKNTDFKVAFSDKVTLLYHLEKHRESLTMTQGRGKHTGLLQFYSKHKKIMTEEDENAFLKRSKELFGLDSDFFQITDTSMDYSGFPAMSEVNENTLRFRIRKIVHKFKKIWWRFRVRKGDTKVLGRQFTRTREKIEIDLTYACNLRCQDCNRSCRQAPDGMEIQLEKIQKFVDDSLSRSIAWKKIRLLGGEPTLHSKFEEVLYEIGRYKFSNPRCRLEVVTNGYGRKVKRKLLNIPPFFHIENTMKDSDIQPQFYSFNVAMKDKKGSQKIDFTNGCSNIEQCGIGLTPSGYYPCAIAGGIDRVAGWNLGRKEIPEEQDDMLDLLNEFCNYCGRFESRYFTPPELMPNSTPGVMSSSWEQIYDEWKARRAS